MYIRHGYLFPRELSDIMGIAYSKIKIAFDVICLAVTALLTGLLLGRIDGLGIGTVVAVFTMGKDMNLDYIRYFVKLAEVQHYTKAADELCISQPSLSHAIRQMEEELGVPLFEKRGHNTKLTQMGEVFLEYSKQTLSILDEGISGMHRSAKGGGLIRLGFLRVL